MKKQILAILAGSLLAFGTLVPSAMAKDSVGVVDTRKVFETSKLAESINIAQIELKNLEEDFKKDTLNKSKLLEEARDKKVSEAEIKKLQEKFTKEMENKRKDGENLSQKKQKEIEDLSKSFKTEVDKVIQEISKEKQLEVVVDKQAVLFGGNDITEEVIKRLKK